MFVCLTDRLCSCDITPCGLCPLPSCPVYSSSPIWRGAAGVAIATELEPQFQAPLEKEKVPQAMMDWLKTDDVMVLSVRAFAACATSREKVDDKIIAASGLHLTFGGKVD